MSTAKRFVSVILTLLILASAFTSLGVFVSAAANPYSEAAMNLDKNYAYDGELGAIYSPEATTFKVWAPLAESVKLNRYATGSDSEEGAADLGAVSMTKLKSGSKFTGVWTVTVSGDLKNTYYTYTIKNPKHIVNSSSYMTKECQDIYSYAVGVNGNRSMVVDLDSTDPEGWSKDKHIYVDSQADAIIWEVQVKDFSYAANSGVSEANRGKYLAFTETGTTLNNEGDIATCVDYLKQLGVTHIQLNPFYDFATINEASGDSSQYNWGYDPKNYGVPDGSFSSDPFDGNVRINEAKRMIKALHDAGIGVIMDVVFNHTFSVESPFNYSVPEYYYRMTSSGGYSQQSGCGNDTASERYMFRRYMRDMLNYWVEEYHIDGYRFDLMGVHDVETLNLIRDDMDKIDRRIIMYGEGWAGDSVFDPVTCTGTSTKPCSQGNAKYVSERVGFFNDLIRDGVKGGVFDAVSSGFVSGSVTAASSVSYGIRANTFGSNSTWSARSPEQCVTYTSCHDNMTLYDKLVACNFSPYADYRTRYSNCITQNKLSSAIINSSQGIDFMLAGEEMGRSKDGDENSYNSPATLNMIDWSLAKTNADLVSYYKGMIELRKAFSPFTAATRDIEDTSYDYFLNNSLTASSNQVAYIVNNTASNEWSKVAVIFNGSKSDESFTFTNTCSRNAGIDKNTRWVIVADKNSAGVTALGETKGLTFNVPAGSAVIAVEKSTFENVALKSRFSKVTINSVRKKNSEDLSVRVLLGEKGESYVADPDESISLKYELVSTEGETSGVFGDTDKTVTYKYIDYVPKSLLPENGDVDNDGDITIVDGTNIQRHLARIAILDDDFFARGDYNYSGVTEITDVTVLQRYLANFNVALGSVTTNYYGTYNGETSEIARSVTKEGRLGTEYTTTPADIPYYVLRETPSNASGVISGGMTVNYYYDYSVNNVTVHVKHNGSLTWEPNLWAWSNDSSGSPIDFFSSWPGAVMNKKDSSGWYKTTLSVPAGLDYYFLISNEGDPKSDNYGPFSYSEYPEIWIVIDDSNVGKTGTFLSCYNSKPNA